ncbi:EAL domain-containing protein [Cohnella rhizosphaerae]|uniref:EAL domain-containing protein n=1 Tax=Cohnella rhizosphaerae TaxID=1457232 RepID=A0A9X4QW05_9BACL|nr:EAL domain-containing protein [Cohnella rhizosphaerae]MDG0813911.1 EAL domain-containing protein [Cohnella rhizosphaerae]
MIVAMARQLKLDIVAEGVENEELIRLLKELGCFNVQGYYCSQPMPAEEIPGSLQPDRLRWRREASCPTSAAVLLFFNMY